MDCLFLFICVLIFFPSRIRPVPIHSGLNQQYVIKPKYYHTHTTHTQMHVQPQPERPIPLTVGHNSIHGEQVLFFLLLVFWFVLYMETNFQQEFQTVCFALPKLLLFIYAPHSVMSVVFNFSEILTSISDQWLVFINANANRSCRQDLWTPAITIYIEIGKKNKYWTGPLQLNYLIIYSSKNEFETSKDLKKNIHTSVLLYMTVSFALFH